MKGYRWAAIMAAVILSAGIPMTAAAAGNYDMRRKVIRLSGIMSNWDEAAAVTREEYAQMLVNASTYRQTVLQASPTAVFSDVPAASRYAGAVRCAVENGWMSGYLGGVFRPSQPITYQEAIRGILALLGYTDEDFSGSQMGGRWAKFHSLELGEDIGKEPSEILTRTDCVNLFYQLLCAKTTTGKDYCTLLGYELSGEGEVNPLTIADNELKGPKVVKKGYLIGDQVPFKVEAATFYLDGQISTLERVNQEKSNGFIVIYYNINTKTIWAYGGRADQEEIGGNMMAVLGKISGIYYASSSVMTPSAVILDDNVNTQYRLESADVQFAFSIYGEFRVGDHVILICEKSGTDTNGDPSYKVIDYIEY